MDNLVPPATDQKKPVVPGMAPVAEDQYAAEAPIRLNREALSGGIIDSTARAFRSGDNYAAQIYKRINREASRPDAVPGYDPKTDLEKHKNEIPGSSVRKFIYAQSPEEFSMILQDVKSETHDREILAARYAAHPVSTIVASGLAGLVDVDTPAALLSGGLAEGAKAGSMLLRAGRGALAGAASQMAMATVANEAGTTGDWREIPMAGFAGAGFGLLGGMFHGGKAIAPEAHANEALHAANKEFTDTMAEGHPLANIDIRNETQGAADHYGSVKAEHDAAIAADVAASTAAEGARTPKSFSPPPEEPITPASVGEPVRGSSVGAQQLDPQGSVSSVKDARSADMIQTAQERVKAEGLDTTYFDNQSNLDNVSPAVANAARRFNDAVQAVPGLATDFDRLFNSGSAVAKTMAYDLFESASGIVRNNRTAAMLREHHDKELLGSFMPEYEDAYSAWARERGLSRWNKTWSAEARQRFHREMAYELNARFYDAPDAARHVNEHVAKAADAHDTFSAKDIEIGKGREGEHSIKGYEDLQPKRGYFSQKWDGARMSRMIHAGTVSEEAITQAISEGYQAMHGVGKKDADVWAAAVVRRARASDRGTDVNLIGLLQQDGRAYLEQMLKDQGHSADEIKTLIDRLTGQVEKRGQVGQTKHRVNIDMRFKASNGVDIIDLMDTNIPRMVARRARGTSGQAALARKGIRSRADKAAMIEAILQEQQARGPSKPTGHLPTDIIDADRHLTRQHLEDLFSYFDAGPIAGGLSPTVSRMKKLTNLALLNQLGLTQMAEVGVQISAVGVDRWWRHAGAAFKEMANNADSPLAKELQHLNVMVPEERLFRDDIPVEMDRVGTAASEFGMKFDHLLNTGARVQGYMSGFYHARKFQQRVAVTSAADKIMQNMKGLANDLSGVRAADMGLDPKTYARIKKYVDNGTVEFKDGNLYKLNLDKWDPAVAEDFALSLNRHVHQTVQKAMIGESNVLFHKDGVAALFFHLKSFPLLAMHKQAYRNARIADTEAMYGFLMGLGTAAVAYTVKQAANLNTQNLTPGKVARGAIGLSNMAGWIPMWTDPIAGMLGMNSLKFNSYARGLSNNVISSPAALTTLNKMANIPGAIIHTATGQMSNSDVRAFQTIPLFGQMHGITAGLNLLKN